MKNILIYYDEFELIIKDIASNSTVQKMKISTNIVIQIVSHIAKM